MKTIRIVIQETVSEKNVDAAAWDNDWSLIKTIKADENTPHEAIWCDSIENVNIHYIEDFYIGIAYFVLRGDELDSVIEDIRATLPTYTEDDVFKMLEDYKDDQDNLVKAIYYLGLIAPQQFSPLYFNLFKDVLSHKDPIVRSAVITAIGYLGWQAFKDLLEPLQNSDPDLEVRKDASVMLSGFELYTPDTVIAS
ncbi:hypothetical protein CAL7716_054090 [Calothrix sp. PCC 7716]|nr:hypothetical protein CAL7716_054090 [Calothrix sp. PCC 7716]